MLPPPDMILPPDYWDPEEPVAECYYCIRLLNPLYDWYCIRCDRPACDDCSQACVEIDDCDEITCMGCVEPHWFDTHTSIGRMMVTWEGPTR